MIYKTWTCSVISFQLIHNFMNSVRSESILENKDIINIVSPFHCFYSSLQIREESFKSRGWINQLTQSAKTLSECGFFFLGRFDICVCFYCNLRVSLWEKNQDPFKTHIELSPKCSYILAKSVNKRQEIIYDNLAPKCKICKKKFTSKSNLKRHFLNVDPCTKNSKILLDHLNSNCDAKSHLVLSYPCLHVNDLNMCKFCDNYCVKCGVMQEECLEIYQC